MKVSKMYVPTLKESPSDTDVVSYEMLVRAGMIRKLSSGTYSYLPLGYRVIRKIEQIIREEMDNIDSQETLLPIILPAELWKESGRWDKFGPEMFRVKDRNMREYCLGPTHEEAFTDLIKNELNSYKQLPLSLYQIQNKYRDEIRPRYGLIRGKEFIMKDAYTFDKDVDGLKESYKKMWEAYSRVFSRCGLNVKVAEGDSGAMGGSDSHEFIAFSDVGETRLAFCDKCDYASTDEKAEVKISNNFDEEVMASEMVHTPNVSTIKELESFFNIQGNRFGKALVYKIQEELYIVMIPGDRSLNVTKLINYLGISEHDLELANDGDIRGILDSEPGFVGPILRKDGVRVIVDKRITNTPNLIVGSNKKDYHMKNINYGVDFTGEVVEDLLMIEENDRCPVCGESLQIDYGNEVGNIFQLGDKYSKSMNATFLDENGKANYFLMGSYGIGVSRTLAAIVDQHSNERGIVWPDNVAPYQVIVTIVSMKDDVQCKLGQEIYDLLRKNNVEVMIDDRKLGAGKKFADADLFGIPYRITVGRKAKDGVVEFLDRQTDEVMDMEYNQVLKAVKDKLITK